MLNLDQQTSKLSTSDIEIIKKETVFQGFFKMVKYHFKHKLFNGQWSPVIEREMFERGHAVAVLPYDSSRDQVILIEQIRVGALEDANPWQLEIVAGIIEHGELSEDVARREAVEEAGVEVGRLIPISSYYPSSGGCCEKLDVFVGEVDTCNVSGFHGLAEEGEDIRVMVVSREQAYQLVLAGKIENGASIIALQWLALNYQRLQMEWSR